MPANERVAAIKTKVNQIVGDIGLVKDNKLSKLNGRDVYRNPQTGEMFALDTQHGRFEVINPKNGKHMGEVNFDFNTTKPADTSGGHNIKVK